MSMELSITKVNESAKKPIPGPTTPLGFGRYYSDHMLMMNYTADHQWHDARIVPYAPLSLDPACAVLHYGQQVFEGLKAYRGTDGAIRLFRHRDHFQRLNRSAQRLCMPCPPPDVMEKGLKELLKLDQAWIPTSEGSSLYIRPNIIAYDPVLGVRPSQTYLFYMIMSPVGAYYAEGFNPVKICVNERYVRAVVGGIGEAKTGGNYAASMLGQKEAKAQGFTQVLWLDGTEHRYIEEVGTMNIFFVIGNEVLTSPLTGSILAGVTRDTVLQLLRQWGDLKVTERRFTIDEVVDASNRGDLREVFGTGTAAVISPVSVLSYREKNYTVGDGKTGQLSQRLYDTITAIQYGKQPDTYGWMTVV